MLPETLALMEMPSWPRCDAGTTREQLLMQLNDHNRRMCDWETKWAHIIRPARSDAQRFVEKALCNMRDTHWNPDRWNIDSFWRYTQMCADAGVGFDADMCDEVCRLIRDLTKPEFK